MNTEFHYYITYLIAARAGLPPEDAQTLAWASQYTDDNNMIFTIDSGLPTQYDNYISQTVNILKPRDTLLRIYPLFHFIPGDPMAPAAWRKDGVMHWLNTTPGSENANQILSAALTTNNLYRIGIACHAYADTWAHQNFVGYYNEFNSMTGPFTAAIPNIGHADAGNAPDGAALLWQDERLIRDTVDNKARFLEAAACMFAKLAKHADPKITKREINKRSARLKDDLGRCIGAPDPEDEMAGMRIARYSVLSLSQEYGGQEMPPYDADRWMDEAVNEDVRGLRDRGDFPLAQLDPFGDVYTWKDRANYKQTHWHRFQEAVKQHQNETWQLLEHKNFQGLDLPHL